jgi:hypothetical protein
MEKGKFYEILVRLYLRLNGYLQTGLISHSAKKGDNATEIDSIAVRFALHQQPEREVGFCPVLNPSSGYIDIVLAEVKSTSVEFNKPLKKAHKLSDRNWTQILKWIGLFEESEILKLIPHLASCADSDASNLAGIDANSIYGHVKIRPIIFSIENPASSHTPKAYINGEEVIDYIWTCFCPLAKRADCSTKYPLSNWGSEFEKIVKYFKARNDSGLGSPSLADIQLKFSLK